VILPVLLLRQQFLDREALHWTLWPGQLEGSAKPLVRLGPPLLILTELGCKPIGCKEDGCVLGRTLHGGFQERRRNRQLRSASDTRRADQGKAGLAVAILKKVGERHGEALPVAGIDCDGHFEVEGTGLHAGIA
jgi:hypothetical protein